MQVLRPNCMSCDDVRVLQDAQTDVFINTCWVHKHFFCPVRFSTIISRLYPGSLDFSYAGQTLRLLHQYVALRSLCSLARSLSSSTSLFESFYLGVFNSGNSTGASPNFQELSSTRAAQQNMSDMLLQVGRCYACMAGYAAYLRSS